MKITFGTTVICQGDSPTGTVGNSLRIDGAVKVQIREFLRADYAIPTARGNRTHTVSFSITPAPALTGGLAIANLALALSVLPEDGDLAIQEGATVTTFPNAVLTNITPTANRAGVTWGYTLSFITGGPVTVTTTELPDYLSTEDGVPILT
jgi:hypothetical protein